jgi:hypothetical protein
MESQMEVRSFSNRPRSTNPGGWDSQKIVLAETPSFRSNPPDQQ